MLQISTTKHTNAKSKYQEVNIEYAPIAPEQLKCSMKCCHVGLE